MRRTRTAAETGCRAGNPRGRTKRAAATCTVCLPDFWGARHPPRAAQSADSEGVIGVTAITPSLLHRSAGDQGCPTGQPGWVHSKGGRRSFFYGRLSAPKRSNAAASFMTSAATARFGGLQIRILTIFLGKSAAFNNICLASHELTCIP